MNLWSVRSYLMALLFLLLFSIFSLFIFSSTMVSVVSAVSFSCQWRTSCASTTTEIGLLRARNDTGGYNNAHAQLMNYTGTSYNNTLCCDTDGTHTLNNSCSNENATTVLQLYDVTNNHVQVPGIDYASYGDTLYGYDACMALSPGNLTCVYVNSTCPTNYTGIASIASSETNNDLYNQTNAHIANYTYYTLNICCKGGNTPPSVPTLIYPVNNNYTVFDRTINFNWSGSSDPDSDSITYDFNLTQVTCADDYQTSLSTTNYTSGELCVDKTYNWTVRACDQYSCSDWATTWNFTIGSVAGLSFTTNNTDFGTLERNATDNTTDSSPPPFTVENTGNVKLNVTFEATNPLFTTSGLGNDSFQYKAREDESGAYQSSQIDWTNVSARYTSLYTNFGYADSADSAFIDILVHPPYDEPAGSKSSTVEVLGNYTG